MLERMTERRTEMIFDTDAHMSPYRNFDRSINAEELLEIMAKAGIDRSLCWLLPQEVTDVSESNRYIYDSARKYSQLVPFGWANVREGVDKAVRDAEQCISEFGFKGVKLNGAQNEYPIDSLEAMTVIETIARLGGFVAFHIGIDSPDFTNPKRAGVVAARFPEMPVMMVHMGGAGDGTKDCADDVIAVAKEHSNMMLVGSAIRISRVEKAIEELGPERVMFGSDAPFFDAKTCVENYRNMLQKFDAKTAEQVMSGNALKLFGFSG